MAGSTAIDPALVERFKAALERLNPDGGKLGLAVSGGPDSMAMLLLAQEAIPGRFEVATVDHGLRAEAKDECALVVAACEERGVPCEVLTVQVGAGNVQARAREARYDALADWALRRRIPTLATAHHADDQAETLLMRLNRGSGVGGLAGVREEGGVEHWPEVGLIRPLLHFRRADLSSICAGAGVPVADDPSNRDDRFDRVRMRRAIAQADWLDPLALSQSAANLADAEEALQLYTRTLWHELVERDDKVYRLKPLAGREVTLRLLRDIFGNFGSAPRGSDLVALIEGLERGEKSNLGRVLASVDGEVWVFTREPARRMS